jgi:hypothetical protein
MHQINAFSLDMWTLWSDNAYEEKTDLLVHLREAEPVEGIT